MMAQDPPSSDSEVEVFGDTERYQYESEGEEILGASARSLMRESNGNYRRKSSTSLNPTGRA